MSTFITPIETIGFGIKNQKITNDVDKNMPFQNVLSQAISETNRLSEISEQDSNDLLFGDVDNLAQIQINSLKAKTMLQTTVQLTSRAVNAYKEIMQMQV